MSQFKKGQRVIYTEEISSARWEKNEWGVDRPVEHFTEQVQYHGTITRILAQYIFVTLDEQPMRNGRPAGSQELRIPRDAEYLAALKPLEEAR